MHLRGTDDQQAPHVDLGGVGICQPHHTALFIRAGHRPRNVAAGERPRSPDTTPTATAAAIGKPEEPAALTQQHAVGVGINGYRSPPGLDPVTEEVFSADVPSSPAPSS